MLLTPRLGGVIATICLSDLERDHMDISVSRASCGTLMKTRGTTFKVLALIFS